MNSTIFAFSLLAAPQPGIAAQISGMIVPLGLILLVFYFIMWRPQAKKQQEHQSFLNALKTGDEVVTVGGILGTVKSVQDKVVSIEVSKGTKIKVLKSQIRGSADKLVAGDSSEDAGSESTW